MSDFTFTLHEPETGLIDPGNDVNNAEKINCCFICSKPIELQTTISTQNDKKLIHTLCELLTGEKWCSTDDGGVTDDLDEISSVVGFCPECRLYLRLWNDLMASISTILEKTNQIKCTIIANMLTSARIPGQSASTSEGSSSSLIQKLERIRKK